MKAGSHYEDSSLSLPNESEPGGQKGVPGTRWQIELTGFSMSAYWKVCLAVNIPGPSKPARPLMRIERIMVAVAMEDKAWPALPTDRGPSTAQFRPTPGGPPGSIVRVPERLAGSESSIRLTTGVFPPRRLHPARIRQVACRSAVLGPRGLQPRTQAHRRYLAPRALFPAQGWRVQGRPDNSPTRENTSRPRARSPAISCLSRDKADEVPSGRCPLGGRRKRLRSKPYCFRPTGGKCPPYYLLLHPPVGRTRVMWRARK